ncbi:hypothetical protein D7D52_35885 [Nocardia yunnanensis]|uniref:Uncharacterized protein n=1 Tax=Nocardia yunnanensis TaxID=2382165 RepID=A0A386ZL68_9NOCA|nr:hypothetical protein [Nocardia yunnanensis]AYF78321.1 hypothetical protein D7D52_35885 [Nocardia yunnanensis]
MSDKTMHTCNPRNPGQPMPFGKRAPQGQCPRCDELHAGCEPRTLNWVEDRKRTAAADAQRERRMDEHFAPGGPHQRGDCGPVCTAFDY